MTNFKTILQHIFSQNELLKELEANKADLQPSYETALAYACGSPYIPNKKQTHLKSIFDNLAGNTGKGYYFEPKELSITDFNFPTKDKDPKKTTYDAFASFKEAHKQIENFDNRAYADTCLSLLEKHFSYTPCQIQGLEDVSLYDHIKSVMGLMVCLQASESKEKPVLLIGGDISGIQSFIYDIISTHASKNLKGRSFYLQLLVDSVIERLLDSLGLCQANIVYASGGGFYLLAPNTEDIKTKLAKQIKEISEKIYATHKTALHLAIESIEVSKEAFAKQLYQDGELVWDTLIQKINIIHKRKFISLAEFDSLFNPSEVGGKQERDAITNEEFEKEEIRYSLDKDEPNEPEKIKKTTAEQIELGKDLKDFDFIVSIQDDAEKIKDCYNICNLGIHYQFIEGVKELMREVNFGNKPFTLKVINKVEDTLLGSFPNSPHTYTFMLYGGNDYPTIEVRNKKGYKFHTPKTNSEFAGQKEEDENRRYVNDFFEPKLKRLGILRMDVDGLGAIFGEKGFEKQTRTFSKYATLSRNLDVFFKGYLNTIWNNNPLFKENSQIIYAGGDDLFIVGRWDILIEFAEKIQQDFEKWICQNPKLGLSGGMAIVAPKYPIAKGAEKSEKAEKASKGYSLKKDIPNIEQNACNTKNAFAFLGYQKLNVEKKELKGTHIPLNWKNEFVIVKELKDQLLNFVQDSKKRSILMRIQALEYQSKLQKKEDSTESWKWLLAYDFSRFRDRFKGQADLCQQIDEIKTNIFCNTYNGKRINSPYTFLELLSVASRWAELLQQTNK